VGPNHSLAGKKSFSIEDLASENFVAHNVPSPLRQQVISTFAKHNTPLNMGVELPSLEAVKRFVAMGNGVAFVPSLIVEREAESGELVKVTVQGLRAERQLRLVHRRRDNLSHAATAFLKVVHSVSEELQGPFDFRIESPDRVAGGGGDGKSKVRQARRRP
jgi:DNA-binding transcriptional LysR family regulator